MTPAKVRAGPVVAHPGRTSSPLPIRYRSSRLRYRSIKATNPTSEFVDSASNEKGRTMTTDLLATEFSDREWPFEISVESFTAAHAVVRVSGSADMVTSPQLLAVINAAINNYSVVVLDLSQVEFFSSAAIDVVFEAYARRPDSFRVFAPVRPARQVLELFADERLLTESPAPVVDIRRAPGLQDAS
jgi:anti-anti-sigma factor